MRTVRAHFDCKNVVIPPDAKGLSPSDVLLVFTDPNDGVDAAWLGAQEAALARVWENDDDAAHNSM